MKGKIYNFNSYKYAIYQVAHFHRNIDTVNLPKVITELVKTQNDFDSVAYAQCFTETAVVFDKGQTHTGRNEIEQWIEKANKDYQETMESLEYSSTEETLKAEVSGNFPGSPIAMTYHLG